MDFDFTDDQEQLRDAVGKWVERSYSFERRREVVAQGGFSAQTWQELSELGLMALATSDEHGGMGMGPVEAMIVMEQLGQGLVMDDLTQSWMISQVLQNHAEPSVQQAHLPKLASGEFRCVLAHQERSSRYRHLSCKAMAKPDDGSTWKVTGLKSVVPMAAHAHAFVFPAQMDGRLALFWVQADAPGVQVRPYVAQDGSSSGDVQCDQAPATLITADGEAALDWCADFGVAMACAEAVGIMDRTVGMTAEYLNTRKQFGVVIASFQALRHRLADMKMQLELGRSMSFYATLKLGEAPRERRQAMARAKHQLSQSMRYVGQQAIQLHGGIGVTDEYMVGHCFKRLTQLELSWGDGLHHLGVVSDHMQDTAGVF
jgi:alkylation response protein AidB-like acyl-CoA dehydrogenase